MVTTILRNTASVLCSIFIAVLLLAGIEWLGAILHPFPADFAGTREEVAQHVANYPAWILALLGGAGWGLTSFVITFLATRLNVNKKPVYGFGVGVVFLAAAIFNMTMLPYPLWYRLLELVVLPLGIFLGIKLARSSSKTEHLSSVE